jgi:hypothetical protein
LSSTRAVESRAQLSVGVGYVDLGHQGSGGRIEGVGDPRDLARKAVVGNLRHPDHGVDTGLHSDRCVLRHVEPDPHDVALGQGEHEGAARCIGLDQAADIDVASGHDAGERGDDPLISLLLAQHQQLGLLRLDGRIISLFRLLLSRIVQAIGVALLLGGPALFHQNRVATPSDPSQFTVRLGLPARRLGLSQTGLGLGDLVVELRRGDCRQEVAHLHAGADIDIAFRDIPAGPRENVRGLKSVGGSRQGDAHRAGTGPHRVDADARDEVTMLLGGDRDLEVQRVMPPNAERQSAEEQ